MQIESVNTKPHERSKCQISYKFTLPSLRTGAPIAAVLDSFGKLVFVTYFLVLWGSGNLLNSLLSLIISTRGTVRAWESPTHLPSFCTLCRRWLTNIVCFSFFVLSARTACFHIVSHDHLQALRISHSCSHVEVMSLEIWSVPRRFIDAQVSTACAPCGVLAMPALLLERNWHNGKKYIYSWVPNDRCSGI